LALNVKTQKESIEESARKILLSKQNKELFQAFLTAAKTTTTSWEDTIKEFRSSLEKWFDDSMQRVTGWYKRKTQVIILCLALPICFCLNVDTIGIANSLYSDPALRESVVAAAEATVQQAVTNNSTLPTYAELSDKVTGLNIHLGWTTEQGDRNKKPDTGWGWLTKIFGILITVFAVSLGAPFWFDLLNKLVNLRAAGKTPKKTEETPATPT
jgi:hypothetical protein